MCGSIDTGTLARESSWANIRDRTVVRHFDAAQMLGPMAVASTLGIDAAATEGAWRSEGAVALLSDSGGIKPVRARMAVSVFMTRTSPSAPSPSRIAAKRAMGR